MAGTGVKFVYVPHDHLVYLRDNVLYITLEMHEEKIAERIDANLLNISLNELRVVSRDDYENKFQSVEKQDTRQVNHQRISDCIRIYITFQVSLL